jgi:hypothetical protein
MVAQVETTIVGESLLIDVHFKVDEGKQYDVRTVEIHGLNLQTEEALKSQLEPGRVFDSSSLWNLLKEHNAGLPTDMPFDDAIKVRRDVASTSVDVLIDFRPCPKP